MKRMFKKTDQLSTQLEELAEHTSWMDTRVDALKTDVTSARTSFDGCKEGMKLVSAEIRSISSRVATSEACHLNSTMHVSDPSSRAREEAVEHNTEAAAAQAAGAQTAGNQASASTANQ